VNLPNFAAHGQRRSRSMRNASETSLKPKQRRHSRP
jgi:hypothetical protein